MEKESDVRVKLKKAARVLLLVAAIALVSVKIAVVITPDASPRPPSPAGYESPAGTESTAQEMHLHGGGPVAYTVQSSVTAPADCVTCYQAAPVEECPDHCQCLTEGEAAGQGWTLCNGQQILCYVSPGLAAAPVMKYCYQAPVEETECPHGCVCVTEAIASQRGYPGFCHRVPVLCGHDAHGTPEYCYADTEIDEPVVCRDEDIDLRQVRLDSGEIRFIADISCPVSRVDMIIDGVRVRECTGRYCEFTGGPYPLRVSPDFSAVLFDHLDEEVGNPAFEFHEIVVTMPEDISVIDYDPCPLCPEPEPAWGDCQSHACRGNDHFQAYDWTSQVQLTGCFYENYAMTGGLPIDLGEGLIVEIEVAPPFFDYCINDDDIMLHRCRNGVISQHVHTCPYGCYSGMCTCATSDGGINFYEPGGVIYGSGVLYGGTHYVAWARDYCIDDKMLREYYTEVDHENNTCTIKWIEFECPGVCEDGACRGTCFDGIQNEGELGIDCGGPCLAACEHDVGWYPQNYGFTFGNPGGKKLSYGSCWSRSRSCSSGYGDYKGTFGNCGVCICNSLFRCCTGWRIGAGLYYPIYRYAGAPAGQCTGMCLSSLAFYYGDREVQEYDPFATEVKHLENTGTLRDHIAAGQGKTVSHQNINHYLFHSSYWGANDVLNKVESALDNDPPDYGLIFMIEDNGWGGPGGGLRREPLGHTVIATNVVYEDDDTARIYVYDPDRPVAEEPTEDCPYFNIDNSPYIEIHKPSNTYTYYGPNPHSPARDWDNQLWSNANNEHFDRIGYMPYSKLGGSVDIPSLWDVATVLILGVLGSADSQVEDGDGGILGFSENGPGVPAIEDGLILPVFGEPDPDIPTTFALPMGDYQLNIRGNGGGKYSAYILGGSPHAFAISDAEVGEGTRDTISIKLGAPDEASLSFSTSDAEKRYSLQIIASLGEENGDVIETLYTVKDSTIFSGSRAAFSIDPVSQSLRYTNYGNKAVTYSVQVHSVTIPSEGTVQHMATSQSEANWDCAGGCAGTLMAAGYGAYEGQATGNSHAEGDLAAVLDNIQVTEVYTFTIGPNEKHTVSPEDWSDLPASGIRVTSESVAASPWPLLAAIIVVVVAISIAAFFLMRRRKSGASPDEQ